MKARIWLLVFWSLLFAKPSLPSASPDSDRRISNYELDLGIAVFSDGRRAVVLRKFRSDNDAYLFTVDPDSLSTGLHPATDLRWASSSWEKIRTEFHESAYIKALEQAESNSRALQDAGLTHFLPSQGGIDLTIDLCPSRLPLDRRLFSAIIQALQQEESPVPMAVAITGLWMQEHPQDLEWLASLEKNKQISITWVNHSYNHRTSRGLPLRQNFLLEKGTDITAEVLKNEILMIENGIIPSLFFRFPGLVSDSRLFSEITSFGLIPLGSDAWLGKNQWPNKGSIVLVHANGNEPYGIERFLKLLREERQEILSKHWLLFDLRESTVMMEKEKK